MSARFTRLEPPSSRGCDGCDNGLPVQFRAFCGRCRTLLGYPVPVCVLCADKGWRARDMRWVRCECAAP